MTSGSSSLRKKAAKASPVFPCPRVSQRMLIYHQWVYGLTFDSEYFHLWFRASTAVRADTHTTQSRWVSSKWILCFLDSWTGPGVSCSPRDNEQTPFALGSHGNHVSFFTAAFGFLTDLLMMETTQTSGSCPAPSQAAVRPWISSSTRGI